MTDPRIYLEHVDGGVVKVHIRWPDDPDAPATTVLHGPLYGSDHIGYTTAIPEQAVELAPIPAPIRPRLRGHRTETR
jgi:hypothetical protein